MSDPELDRLCSILRTFNEQFGNIEWTDADDTELFKQFSDNDGFKRWLSDGIFQATYRRSA